MQQRQPPRTVVIRKGERKTKQIPSNPVHYETLSPEGAGSLGMFIASAPPGTSTGSELLRHGGDEELLVLSSRFELEVEGEKQSLGPGDSVFIPRGLAHRLTNVGDERGEAVFVLSPPEY